jgi:trimethylamine:corrinoid methyltransferase-like protein
MPEVVADVGSGGHFLKARQTRQHTRTGEPYPPQLMLRELRDSWSAARHGELERAAGACEEILAATGPSLSRPAPPSISPRSSPPQGGSSAGGSRPA